MTPAIPKMPQFRNCLCRPKWASPRPLSVPNRSRVRFGVSPLFLSLAITGKFTAFGGSEGYFILAIIAFGAFEFIVPKYYYRLGKMESEESRLLI